MAKERRDGSKAPGEASDLRSPKFENSMGKTPAAAGYDYAITMAEMGCLRMYMKWGLFDKIPRAQSISFKKLSQEGGVNEELATRIGQMLISTGKLYSPETAFVSHTPSSLAFTKGGSTGIIFCHFFDIHLTSWASWPAFFTKYGPNEPKDETHNPVAFANGADGQSKYWEIFATRGREFIAEFAQSMEQLQKALPITGIYDFTWIGQYARDNVERPLIVDVGGGKGHILRKILAEAPYESILRSGAQKQDSLTLRHCLQGIEQG